MRNVLYLVHRIPYPPNKGDKIRSFHLLQYLAQRYRVHLGTFVDDPDDWQHVERVRQYCVDAHFAALQPRTAKLRSAAALFADRALSLDYYRNKDLASWVRRTVGAAYVDRIVVFSSAMAQYVEQYDSLKRVIDFVDIDSDKWLQYAPTKRWPLSWLYRREARQLLQYERKVARAFDASLFVSEAEAQLFRTLAPESRARIGFFNNGVDLDYFSPARQHQSPYESDEKAIVFTGAMDYWPNVDAVQWFATEVFPAILKTCPSARFYIVGARPTLQVMELARLPSVHVTGTVPDVRPYVAHAAVAVAPLRIARGIQNKVLEAMALAKPVVVSPQALEGIDAEPGRDLLLARNASELASAVQDVLSGHHAEIGSAARHRVEQRYGWQRNLARVGQLLGDDNTSPGVTPAIRPAQPVTMELP